HDRKTIAGRGAGGDFRFARERSGRRSADGGDYAHERRFVECGNGLGHQRERRGDAKRQRAERLRPRLWHEHQLQCRDRGGWGIAERDAYERISAEWRGAECPWTQWFRPKQFWPKRH